MVPARGLSLGFSDPSCARSMSRPRRQRSRPAAPADGRGWSSRTDGDDGEVMRHALFALYPVNVPHQTGQRLNGGKNDSRKMFLPKRFNRRQQGDGLFCFKAEHCVSPEESATMSRLMTLQEPLVCLLALLVVQQQRV